MIRPLTLICVMLFLFSGFYDYQVTHRVDQVDQQISQVRQAAADTRSDSKMLQTEWSWLNRPDRLQPFAAQFLNLQELTPSQYVAINQLAQHLPQAGAPPITAAQLAANDEAAAKQADAPPVQLADARPNTPPAPNTSNADTSNADSDDGDDASPTPAAVQSAKPAGVPPVASQVASQVASADDSAPAPVVKAQTVVKTSPPSKPAPVEVAAVTPAPKPAPVLIARSQPAKAPTAKPVQLAASSGKDATLAALDRELESGNAAYTPSALGEAHRARPAPRPVTSAPVALARATPHLPASLRPARPVLVADNASSFSSIATPRSASALGMAQTSYSLPPPVAVADVSYRGGDQ